MFSLPYLTPQLSVLRPADKKNYSALRQWYQSSKQQDKRPTKHFLMTWTLTTRKAAPWNVQIQIKTFCGPLFSCKRRWEGEREKRGGRGAVKRVIKCARHDKTERYVRSGDLHSYRWGGFTVKEHHPFICPTPLKPRLEQCVLYVVLIARLYKPKESLVELEPSRKIAENTYISEISLYSAPCPKKSWPRFST